MGIKLEYAILLQSVVDRIHQEKLNDTDGGGWLI